jgi:2-dehydro-3-deoxy-D-arabinonate dehydratase
MSKAIKLYQTKHGIIAEQGNHFFSLTGSWSSQVNRKDLYTHLNQALTSTSPLPSKDFLKMDIEAPIDLQEVWAAGVTYQRSKSARMDEAQESGASVFYDMVYAAERPEIFFKATPHRVVGTHQPVRIRKDSTWNVPEPELTLFISSSKTIEGYTIGNDMSSRSIEGENPLYLPQAKSYDGCAAIGPCLYVPEQPLGLDTGIHLSIERNGREIFTGDATLKQMKRSLTELASWLTRECSFPNGVYLMTGTCLVPENNFTLQTHDRITIGIDGIGILTNSVAAN